MVVNYISLLTLAFKKGQDYALALLCFLLPTTTTAALALLLLLLLHLLLPYHLHNKDSFKKEWIKKRDKVEMEGQEEAFEHILYFLNINGILRGEKCRGSSSTLLLFYDLRA